MLNCLAVCDTHQFACDNERCIAMEYVCNYFDNCGDNSDERGCAYPPGKFCLHLTLTSKIAAFRTAFGLLPCVAFTVCTGIIYVKINTKTLQFNKYCKGLPVKASKQQKSFWG